MELAIDTASEVASLALTERGELRAELSWRCRRNHTVELLPSLDRLLAQAGAAKEDLEAVFVCLGPGGYTGLRAGVATAQGLAYALGIAALGVGRLELDAYPHRGCGRPVVPVHRAGRGALAWAAYAAGEDDDLRQLLAPRISSAEALAREAPAGALLCGEVDEELARLLREAAGAQAVLGAAGRRRAAYLGELGYRRLVRHGGVPPASLRPVYLREPAIGPSANPMT